MESSKTVECVLCQRSEENEVTGALSTKEEVTAHQNCLLYSSGLYCRESPHLDDLFGFSTRDVLKERRRGCKLTCSKCKKKGATVGCETKSCPKSFHYPCAIQAGAEAFEDKKNGRFGLYCLRCNNKKLGLPDDDSNSSSPSTHNPKRKLDFNGSHNKSKARKHSRIIPDDSDSDVTNASEEMGGFAPLESDVEENAKTTPNDQLDRNCAPGTSSDLQIPNLDKADNAGPSAVLSEANSEQSLLLLLDPTDVSMDSSNFWTDCVSAGCTKALFNDFIEEMTEIYTRITSGQASKKDCDVAFNVMLASGKLQELVAKQQQEYQKKLTELQQAEAALKRAALFLQK